MTVPVERRHRAMALIGLSLLAGAVVGGLVVGVGRPDRVPTDEAPEPVPADERPDGHETRTPNGSTPDGDATAAGVPGGFGHDETGAVAASLAYTALSQRWLYASDDEVAAMVAGVAAPHAEERLTREVLAEVRTARRELAASPGRVWWLVHPLAWKTLAYSPSAASVAVWTVTVLSAAEVAAPQAEWMTVTVDLSWTDGGWRVETVNDRPGPTPMTGPRDDPWDAEPFDDALAGFTRLDGAREPTP
jgi:hypothetical protein